jgi:hypothetical protein
MDVFQFLTDSNPRNTAITADNLLSNANVDVLQQEETQVVANTRIFSPVLTKRKKSTNFTQKKMVYELDKFYDVSKLYCCDSGCIYNFTKESVTKIREEIHSKDRHAKNAHIKSMMRNDDNGIKRFYADGIKICQVCFILVTGVSKKLIYSKKIGPVIRVNDAEVQTEILKFLKHLESTNNYMPDKQEVHVSYPTRKECYKVYRESRIGDDEANIGSYPYFLRVWKKFMPQLKLRKVIRFAKCSYCVSQSEEIDNNRNPTTTARLRKELNDHIHAQSKDRAMYANIKNIAKSSRNSTLSISIDGSDMSCYGLPYFNQKTKETEKGFKIPIKLTGVIVHGHGHIVYTFPTNIPTGANLTIDCLHRTLDFMQKRYAEYEGNALPRVLFIQVIFDFIDFIRWIIVGERIKISLCWDI